MIFKQLYININWFKIECSNIIILHRQLRYTSTKVVNLISDYNFDETVMNVISVNLQKRGYNNGFFGIIIKHNWL